jgi:glycosyltransferase involved in cell wall biosynthesis
MTICLSMIVKDEAPVIRRCLDSVLPIIDSWAIVDTGSTDGTQEIITEHLRDLPGSLIEHPWVDFAHNRNQALDLAHGAADYIFVIDADEILEYAEEFVLPELDADSYHVEMRYGGCTYLRKQIVRASLPWRYRGVVHEYFECPEAKSEGFIAGMRTVPHHDGARARSGETYRRDAEVLERALVDEPGNARYVFYLAQSLRDAGDLEAALGTYRRRADMGGWPEEVWYSLYQSALLEERLGRPWGEVMESHLAAHEHTPDRAGPLFHVGIHYQQQGNRQLAHLFLERAMKIPVPGLERLFVERPVYEFARALEYAVACFYVGDHQTAIATNNELLRSRDLPPELIEQVTRNRRFSLDAIARHGPVLAAPTLTVVVALAASGPELDDCVESLVAQQAENVRVVLVAGDSDVDPARLALDDPRFELRAGTLEEVLTALRDELAEPDVVLVLDSRDRLAEPTVLELIRMSFIDGGCMLLYGQHRDAAGRLGDAEPAADAATFASRGSALAGASPLAFRAGQVAGATWEEAGFAGTRYLDEVLTARAPDQVLSPVPAARPRPSEPLISCLMVTRDRLRLAKAAITSYARQTHQRRELVIVTDGDARFRDGLARFVDTAGIAGVRIVVPAGEGLALGQLRNLAVAAARGAIVCQWDDDDFSHPERLARQLAHMTAHDAGACLMTDHLQLMERERVLFWVDWTDGGRLQGQEQLAPGTLMMAREIAPTYPEDGPFARRGEDSVLLAALFERVPVAHLQGEGSLWLYTYHGANTFPEEHHRRLSAFSMPRELLVERAAVIRDAIEHLPVPGPRDGVAFAVR